MKDKTSPEGVASTVIGSLITALRVVETLNKTYQGALDTVADYQKILVIGMLDGILAVAPETALSPSEMNNALANSIDQFKEQDSSFTTKMMQDFKDRYNKQYEALSKIAKEQDLERSLLQTGDKLLKESDLFSMLAAAEKLTNKMASPESLHDQIVKGATAVKAASNVAQNEIVLRLFLLGKAIGSGAATNLKPEGSNAAHMVLSATKDAYLIYDYVSGVMRKTAKLPSKALDIGIGACIALATGVIDAIIEKQDVQVAEEVGSKVKRSTLEKLKGVSSALKAAAQSVCDDFREGYKFQKEKLDKVDEKVKTDKGMEKVLAEKPGAKPEELEALKSFHSRSLKIVRPVTDVIKAGTKVVKAGTTAVKGTVFSTSFKIGKWIGAKCFASKGKSTAKQITIVTERTTSTTSATSVKSHKAKKSR